MCAAAASTIVPWPQAPNQAGSDGGNSSVPNGQEVRNRDVQLVEAADRAGAIVTDQVRSIISTAETRAREIRSDAERDAGMIRQQAADAANRVLERLGAVEGPLGELVSSLRREADTLTADLDRRLTH
jgi:hypothetical protein